MTRSLQTLALAMLVILAIVASASITYAHADYERSDPPAGATLTEPPQQVRVWFTQELFRRDDANRLEVIGPDGDQVDLGDAYIDDDNRSLMGVSLQDDLPDGIYTVRWQTLSAEDGDEDSGEFSFTVDPSAPDVAEPTTENGADPTETPVPSAATAVAPESQATSADPLSQDGIGFSCPGGAAVLMFGLAAVLARRKSELSIL